MEGILYTLWDCSVGVSCDRCACSYMCGSVCVCPVGYGLLPLGMVPLVSGTSQNPASSLTILIIGGAKN